LIKKIFEMAEVFFIAQQQQAEQAIINTYLKDSIPIWKVNFYPTLFT